LFNIHAGLF